MVRKSSADKVSIKRFIVLIINLFRTEDTRLKRKVLKPCLYRSHHIRLLRSLMVVAGGTGDLRVIREQFRS